MAFHLPENIAFPKENTKLFIALSLLFGILFAGIVYFVEPRLLLLSVGAIVFTFLLIFKIEVAVIIALLVQNQLSQYNYLGGGTPLHPNGIMGVAIIGGTIWFFISHTIDFSRLRNVNAMLGFLAICIMQLLSSIIYGGGANWLDRVSVTLRLLAAISIYLILLYKLDSLRSVKWTIAVVLVAQILPTVNGLLIAAGTNGFSFFEYADTARLGNSGVGVYLAMMLTLSLVFFLNSRKGLDRLLFGGVTALYALGLFFSYGRAGWISFVVGLAVIGLLRHKKLFLMLPFLIILIVGSIPAISQRFADISLSTLGTGYGSTLAGRVRIWETALQIYPSHPIFGTGYGTGRYLIGDILQSYSYEIHNDYISVLLETGIVGLVLFLIWHGQWLMSLINTYQKVNFDYDKTLTLAVLAVFIVSLVARITDNVLFDSFKIYPLFALVATAMALPRIRLKADVGANSHGGYQKVEHYG